MNPDLSPLDWNFDAVPGGELAACCLWEYARESSTFALSSVRHAEMMQEIRSGKPCVPDAEPDPEYEAFLGAFWNSAEGYMRYYETLRQYGGPAALPWQLLQAERRGELCQQVGVHAVRQPLAPALRRQLEALWKVNLVDWEPVRNQPGYDPDDDSMAWDESVPQVEEPGHDGEPHGETVVAFAVDFRNFSNRQIGEVFTAWLKANRPKDSPEPTGRGRKPGDWRAKLTRLAVMRLLARFPAMDLVDPRRNRLPAVWKTKQFSGSKWADAAKWNEARREADRCFHELFPFLPPEEKPLSWGRQAPGK